LIVREVWIYSPYLKKDTLCLSVTVRAHVCRFVLTKVQNDDDLSVDVEYDEIVVVTVVTFSTYSLPGICIAMTRAEIPNEHCVLGLGHDIGDCVMFCSGSTKKRIVDRMTEFEAPRDAAVRELLEEFGLIVDHAMLTLVYDHVDEKRRAVHFSLNLDLHMRGIEITRRTVPDPRKDSKVKVSIIVHGSLNVLEKYVQRMGPTDHNESITSFLIVSRGVALQAMETVVSVRGPTYRKVKVKITDDGKG